MIKASSVRKGMAVVINKEIFLVTTFDHLTPGNKRAIIQLELKSITSGKIISQRFRSEDGLEQATLDPHTAQYLYKDEQGYHFMDLADYNSFALGEESVGDKGLYLKENLEVEILFHDNKPVVLEVPKSVTLRVAHAEPGIKGDSVSNNTKSVTLETGLVLQVPLFVDEGTMIRVDTRTGDYLSRE
jgi:elongation factor P